MHHSLQFDLSHYTRWNAFACLLVLMIVFSAGPATAQFTKPNYEAATINPGAHHFNDIFYVQPHNSYKHGATLTGWLDHGLRSLELDVIDKGGWENETNGPLVAHATQGSDQNCSIDTEDDRLGHCLQDIIDWLDSNPTSPPILLLVDMKSDWDPANAWYGDEVAELDQWIMDFLGDRMYKFSDLYDHFKSMSSGTPRYLAAAIDWPTVATLQGKIIVGLTGGRLGDVNYNMDQGLQDLYFNYNRFPATFLCPDVENDPNEVAVGGTIDSISNNNSQFYLCSNLKAQENYHLTANMAAKNRQIIHLWGEYVFDESDYAFNYLAVAHGVQAIGRDFDEIYEATDFEDAIPYVGVRQSLPGYFEMRPTDNTALCMDVSQVIYSNGQAIHQWDCWNGDNQKFVYNASGELRPKGDNRFCVDIVGAQPASGVGLHLWDCYGGSSARWEITREGRFRSVKNSAYCIDADVPTTLGVQWQTYSCGSWDEQKFWLNRATEWTQTTF